MSVVPLLNSSICYFSFTLSRTIYMLYFRMNSSVLVCDVIFSLMRTICESSIYIVKNGCVQQAVGGSAECVLILGTWFESHTKFLIFFSKLMNSFTNEFI
jgi:hypothetical protein